MEIIFNCRMSYVHLIHTTILSISHLHVHVHVYMTKSLKNKYQYKQDTKLV